MTDLVYCNSCGAIDRPAFDDVNNDYYCSNCGRGNIEDVTLDEDEREM